MSGGGYVSAPRALADGGPAPTSATIATAGLISFATQLQALLWLQKELHQFHAFAAAFRQFPARAYEPACFFGGRAETRAGNRRRPLAMANCTSTPIRPHLTPARRKVLELMR